MRDIYLQACIYTHAAERGEGSILRYLLQQGQLPFTITRGPHIIHERDVAEDYELPEAVLPITYLLAPEIYLFAALYLQPLYARVGRGQNLHCCIGDLRREMNTQQPSWSPSESNNAPTFSRLGV